MASVNKVTIVGNLGRDPEVSTTQGGTKVAKFSIATTERYTDQQGNKQEKTEWHNIVAWKRLAEIIEQYVKKGTAVYIEGKLQTSCWDDDQGNKKYKTEIIANNLQMLGGREDSAPQGNSNQAPQDDDDLPF